MIDLIQAPVRLLRRHVGGRSDNIALDRQAGILRIARKRFRLVGFNCFRLTHDLRQAPVEDNDLSEIPEDHVVAFQVPVQNTARMGIGNRVGDGGERGQQGHEFEGVGSPLRPFGMVGRNGAGERPAVHEFHGIKRLGGACSATQFVDRHDAGMLELPRELGFPDKAGRDLGIPSVFREKLLDGHIPIQLPVAGQPDSADPSRGVQTGKFIAFRRGVVAKPSSRRRGISGRRRGRGFCGYYRRLRLDSTQLFTRQ